jgi:hypothetical protein
MINGFKLPFKISDCINVAVDQWFAATSSAQHQNTDTASNCTISTTVRATNDDDDMCEAELDLNL